MAFFEGVVSADINWREAPSDMGAPRLVGVLADDTMEVFDLIGAKDALRDIEVTAVFDGTSEFVNQYRAAPMIKAAQRYGSDDAARFVIAQLLTFTKLDAVPASEKHFRKERRDVGVTGIDVVNTVSVSVKVTH